MTSNNLWQHFDRPLRGKSIILEPLQLGHYEELEAAIDHPDITKYVVVFKFKKWFRLMLEEKQQRRRIPYAIRQVDNHKIIGHTSYYDISETEHSCHVGGTWYNSKVWKTEVHPDCHLAILRHGFEALYFNRIEINAELNNIRAQRAFEKFGIRRDGFIYQCTVLRGSPPRDGICYSILKDEWPRIREGLEKRLSTSQDIIFTTNQLVHRYAW